MDVKRLIQGEQYKLPHYTIPVIIVFACIPIMVVWISYSYIQANFESQGINNSRGILIFYHFINNFCVVALSACLWFLIYSRENNYKTWGLMLTKLADLKRILIAKTIIFFGYYLLYTMISHLGIIFVCLIRNIPILPYTFVYSVLICCFITVAIGFVQFVLHILISNGLIAVALSSIWLLCLLLYSSFPESIHRIFPLFFSTYVVEKSFLYDRLIIFWYIPVTLCFISLLTILVSHRRNFQTG